MSCQPLNTAALACHSLHKAVKLPSVFWRVMCMTGASENKVAMITGAAGALGAELSAQCAAAGWEIVLVDRNRKGLEKIYDRIVQQGAPEPSILEMDLAAMGPQDCETIAAALRDGPARLDALIHCAVSFDGLRPLDQIGPQDWLRQMQVNLNAPWLLSVACLPMLRQSSQGSLYFLSENLDRVSAAYWGAYGISKHGVDALARQFAAELDNSGIQVLAVDPGPMRSPLRASVYFAENPQTVDQPGVAAKRILQLLERKLRPDDCRVMLHAMTGQS
jgi:NAD(P)-dependent dehydrogenase (short-subunit alcohol dehydrogenase family)